MKKFWNVLEKAIDVNFYGAILLGCIFVGKWCLDSAKESMSEMF